MKTGEEVKLLPPFTDFSERREFVSEFCTWMLRETPPGRNDTRKLSDVSVNKVECYNQFPFCPEGK